MRKTLVVTTALSAGCVLFALACGGGGKAGEEPKTPAGQSDDTAGATGAPGAATDPGAGGGDPGGMPSGGGTSTTTTSNLPDGGELQGAKLGGSTRKEIETKGESGPKSTGGTSAGEPGRTAKDIQTIVAARRDDARACYDKALAAHPGIEGDLDVKWKIDPEGNVFDAEVDTTKSQILEPSVGKCIVAIIQKIKFAPSPKGYESRAHYPFNFHPRQQGRDAGR